MPEFPGRLRTPRLAAAPSAPALGELYFNTVTNKLYWWNGTAWVDSTGATGPAGTPGRARWSFALGFDGPCSFNNPPASNSGTAFTVPETGDYLFTFGGSCYTTIAGAFYYDIWVDGVIRGNTKFWFNQTGVHASFPGGAIVVNLAAGIHYLWHKISGNGIGSDSGDRFWTTVI